MTNFLKTEIIYYNCNTDFEFEFNMNALCQMRLLSEASNDRKTMLTYLSRAVARSKAIFITAPFNDEFIETISHSIGFKLETIVPEEYGITEVSTNKFITGGVPLVTEDGIYVGIILESGPQSLILLSNENSLRKKIMKQLVNQYLLDLCNYESAPIVENNTTDLNNTETAEEDIIAQEDNNDNRIETNDIIDTEESVIEKFTQEEEEIAAVEETTDEILKEVEATTEQLTESPITEIKNKNGLTILTAILSIILFILVAFIIYSLVIDPILNGISILENLKKTFSFLF